MGSSGTSQHDIQIVFRQCAVLAEASDAALKALAKGARVRSLSKGQAFVHEGIVPDHFGIVLSGHVRAVHFGHDGRPVTMLVGWPGDAIGLMAMLAHHPIDADVEAAESTKIAIVSRSAIETLLADEPRLSLSLLTDCTRQLFEVMGVVKSLSVDVKARVAGYILQRVPLEKRAARGPIDVGLGITRVELAAELGTVPETLSRAFAALQDEKTIKTRGRAVTVLDVAALEANVTGEAPYRDSLPS